MTEERQAAGKAKRAGLHSRPKTRRSPVRL